MNNYDNLKWETIEKERILHTPVFDVYAQKEVSATGIEGTYVGITCPDWVVVIAIHEGNFVLVRQWRHGEDNLTLEFPGGVADPGEELEITAIRELEEETGYYANKLTYLGPLYPTVAYSDEVIHMYLAKDYYLVLKKLIFK